MKKHIKLYEEYTKNEDSQFFKTKEEIKKWLDSVDVGIYLYTINDDLSVDVHGSVSLSNKYLTYMPVKFRKVDGSLDVSHNQLTNLKWCPEYVGGFFYCHDNKITSMEGYPLTISRGCAVSHNKMTSFVFVSEIIPYSYQNNPCSYIYDELGFKTEAHIEALTTLDPDPADTLRRLRLVNPDRYEHLIKNSRELRFALGLEDGEVQKVYSKVKDIEKGYF